MESDSGPQVQVLFRPVGYSITPWPHVLTKHQDLQIIEILLSVHIWTNTAISNTVLTSQWIIWSLHLVPMQYQKGDDVRTQAIGYRGLACHRIHCADEPQHKAVSTAEGRNTAIQIKAGLGYKTQTLIQVMHVLKSSACLGFNSLCTCNLDCCIHSFLHAILRCKYVL